MTQAWFSGEVITYPRAYLLSRSLRLLAPALLQLSFSERWQQIAVVPGGKCLDLGVLRDTYILGNSSSPVLTLNFTHVVLRSEIPTVNSLLNMKQEWFFWRHKGESDTSAEPLEPTEFMDRVFSDGELKNLMLLYSWMNWNLQGLPVSPSPWLHCVVAPGIYLCTSM